MLQRIQSIYLLLASLVLFALFLFPLAHNVYVNNKPVNITVSGIYQDVNGQNIYSEHFTAITAVTVIVALIPLIIIFLFNNRKQQIALCYSMILVLFGYSYWVAQAVKKAAGEIVIDTHNFGIGLFMSSLSIICILAALKAIQRDEKLVKSADRLR